MISQSFPHLFESGRIGNIPIRNRVVMLPMGTAYASVIGEVTQKTIDHYVERARGGVGLIIVGNVSLFGRIAFNQLVLDADWFLAGHYELAEAVHAEGARICAQLNHPGRQMYSWFLQGRQPVSSSDIPCCFPGESPYPVPRPLEKEEIFDIMDRWAEAAGRAKKVGYDMVELHAAHGYLIEQFMSPYINKRTDEFGGSLENRMRFPLELLKRVRGVVGDNYPVGLRFGADEFVEGGITIQESPAIAALFQAAGVNYLNVSCGIHNTHHKITDTMRDPEGWKAYLWETIKRAVDIPTIAGGGLRTPAFCENVLAERKADFIGLARPLLADPHWAKKAREDRAQDICPCISCLECLHGRSRRRHGAGARRCTVNAATGREAEFIRIEPASVKKKVMVVGGGPAGMEAARVAALRGHRVTLYDRGGELGGALLLAAVPPGKQKLNWFRDYLKRQLDSLRVTVHLRTEVTPEMIRREKPDAVIIATGAIPMTLPSLNNETHTTTAWDILSGKVAIANRKVIVLGGGTVGLETAEYLANLGNQVTVVEMLPTLAPDMEIRNRFVLMQSLEAANVTLLTRKKVEEVVEGGIAIIDKESGEKTFLRGDLIVLAIGARPDRALAEALGDNIKELYMIGDCNQPGAILEAVYEGSRFARRL